MEIPNPIGDLQAMRELIHAIPMCIFGRQTELQLRQKGCPTFDFSSVLFSGGNDEMIPLSGDREGKGKVNLGSFTNTLRKRQASSILATF